MSEPRLLHDVARGVRVAVEPRQRGDQRGAVARRQLGSHQGLPAEALVRVRGAARATVGGCDVYIEGLTDAGAEAVAVCLLHSYRNPAHERALGELIRARAPEMACALSCEVVPEIREYERTTATVLNAYVLPKVAGYHQRLEARLERICRRLDLKPLNDMPDLPVYGTEPRVKCRTLRGPWQEVELRLHAYEEIDRPEF